MSEERKMILEMLREGSISVEEAERLLDSLPDETLAVPEKGPMPKRLVILVEKDGRPKVNLRIPFSLVRVGIRLGRAFGAQSEHDGAEAMELLRDLDIDEILASVLDGDIHLPYTLVDVMDEEKGELTKIVLE